MMTSARTSQHARDDVAVLAEPREPDRWLLLRTRSRHERIVAGALARAGLVAVVPTTRCSRVYGDRAVAVDVPLLPGTVFARGSRESVTGFCDRGWVTEVLEIVEQEQVERDLKYIVHALGVAGVVISAADYRAEDATPAEVRCGPLRGLRGVISGQRSDRLVLPVHAVGRAVSVEVDPASVDIIS